MKLQQRAGVLYFTGLMPDDPRHGTLTGYRAHHRAGEQACLACTDANTDYYRRRRENSKRACILCSTPCTGRAKSKVAVCQTCSIQWSHKTLEKVAEALHKHARQFGETDLHRDVTAALGGWSR